MDRISIRSSFSLLLISLCCFLHCSAAGHEQKKHLPSAVLVGTVYCDTCFHHEFSKSSHFIPGASVAVKCCIGETKSTFRKEVRTNRHGVFRVRLPAEVGKHIDTIKACSVKLIRSSEPFCAIASSATSAELRLKSRRKGIHVFSAGFFTFKPLKQPELCYQEPKPEAFKIKALTDQKPERPAFFFPPPIPFVPSPPNIGGVPLPPNPLQPPPSLLPPLQPPPSVLPPLPFQPPPPPFINLPPLPFLTPPPPPPASLFPPFPFPPLFPGNPPAFPTKETSP